jgi:hypothetical protein
MFPILIDNNIQCLEYEGNMYSIVELHDKFSNQTMEDVIENINRISEEVAEAVEEVEENE